MISVIISVLIGIFVNFTFPVYESGKLKHLGVGTCITVGMVGYQILKEVKKIREALNEKDVNKLGNDEIYDK